MRLQQWGTFSVKDHLRARPFVAEVLLYDKLVIPRPATEKELSAGGPPEAQQEDEVSRWRRNHWDPKAQRDLLDILGEFELAVELPWDGRAQEHGAKLYGKQELECGRSELTESIQDQVEYARTNQPEEAAYLATTGVLALYVANQLNNEVVRKLVNRVRTPGVDVEPVIAYGSYGELKADLGVREDKDGTGMAGPSPYALFGWDFFVPDSEKSDAELLRDAARLASRQDLCETRQYFHGWLKQMYSGGMDPHDAREKMLKMLGEYTAIVRGSGLANAARYAAKVVQIAAPLAGLVGRTER